MIWTLILHWWCSQWRKPNSFVNRIVTYSWKVGISAYREIWCWDPHCRYERAPVSYSETRHMGLKGDIFSRQWSGSFPAGRQFDGNTENVKFIRNSDLIIAVKSPLMRLHFRKLKDDGDDFEITVECSLWSLIVLYWLHFDHCKKLSQNTIKG